MIRSDNILNLLGLLILPLLGSIISNSFPRVLSIEEEEFYLNKYKEGDREARDKLIEHNLRLVAHIVKKYKNTSESKDDLISIGTLGLIKAIDSYKFDSKARIATYASRCIENEILMHLRATKKIKETSMLYQTIGLDKDGNEIHLCDVIEDPEPLILDKMEHSEEINKIKEALKVLTDREYLIIKNRYGLESVLPQTQKELAKELNISRSYISRIEKRALTKLYLEIKK